MKSSQKAIIMKDIKEVLNSKQMLIPMIIVPIIFMMVLPLTLIISAKYGTSNINGMDTMINKLGSFYNNLNNSQIIIKIAVEQIFPSMFILIPIMAASIIGASSFIGEKERKTLEPLLYTPMSIKQLFFAKVIGTSIIAYAVAILSVFVFGIVVDIGGWFYFERLIFPSLKWVILIIWVTPGVTVLGISFMVLISAKANTFQEAQQMSVFIVLPVILMMVGQMSGLYLINTVFMIFFGAIIYLIDFVLIKNVTKRFIPEKLI